MSLSVLNETVKSAREAALVGDYQTSIADYETVLHLLRQQPRRHRTSPTSMAAGDLKCTVT